MVLVKMDKKVAKSFTDRNWYPWFICAMSFVVQFVGMSFHGSFGPLYVKMLREFHEGDSKTAWVASISFAVSLSISPITYRLDEKIGQRNSMIIGSTLFGSSLLISSFAGNINILYLTIGVFLAVGLSFCQAASMFILPHYFGKDYILALGIALSGGSLGSFALSILKGYIFVHFTYRTGMQILASTSVVLLLCGLTFKHPNDSQAAPISGDKNEVDIKEGYPPLARNKSFYMLLVASFFYHIMHLVAYVHLTRLAGDLGITDANAALLPGILAISESIGKIASGKIISYRRSIVLHVYQASWTGMSLCSFLCPLAEGFLGLAFYAVGWGFFLGNANGGCVAFINQLVGNKMLVRAYSIFLLCLSPAALAGPPIAGWLRETTSTYDVAFYVSGCTTGFAAVLLSVVKLLHRLQQRENARRNQIIVDEIEAANSACSNEDDFLYNENLYITENDKKCKLIDVLEKNGKMEEKKVTDDDVFHFQLDNTHYCQNYLDVSKETSI